MMVRFLSGNVSELGSQGVMIVLIPSLKGWDGSIGAVLKVGMGQ